MARPFEKEFRRTDWEQVFARQVLRAELFGDWADGLALKVGDHVLEIGAGPGFVSFALAERVGPSGMVYAVERSAEALAYLERLQSERGVAQIRRIVVDAAALDGAGLTPSSALITMVLHHCDDPAAILRNVTRLLPAGGRVVVGEFDPEGPCKIGPPRENRLAAENVKAWCEVAGLVVMEHRQQTPEHYMIVAARR